MIDPDPTKVKVLFAVARDLSEEERQVFLDEQCSESPALRRDVESLLEHDQRVTSFLSSPIFVLEPLERSADLDSHPSELRDRLRLEPGNRVGPYVIGAFLAGGGSGDVYVAHQSQLDRRVALKVIPSYSESDRDRVLRGAVAASDVHHPSLVEIFDCGEDSERDLLYVAMRFVAGPTLQKILEDSKGVSSNQRTLVKRFLEIAEALGALHARGLIHRDVKPSNIVFDVSEDADVLNARGILVDFGLVRSVEGRHSTIRASLFYVAPEIVLGQFANERSDVYSLGVCMIDLLTGRSPDERKRHPSGQYLPLRDSVPEIDRDLQAIVAKATDQDPTWRYANGNQVAQDVRSWLAGQPVSARSLRGLERMRRWVRANPGRVLSWVVRAALPILVVAMVGSSLSEQVKWSNAATRDWEAGDINSMQQSLAGLWPVTHEFLLDPRLSNLGKELRDPDSDSALAEILRSLREKGARPAELLAARYLERDGLQKHPELQRFLLRSLNNEVERSVQGDELTIRWVALLFFERPDRSLDDVRSSSAFRAALENLLRPEVSSVTRTFALTALGGCGDENSLLRISDWLEELDRGQDGEELRVGVAALDFIGRRSGSCGFSAAVALHSELVVNRLSAANAASESLLRTIAFLRRTSGDDPLSVLPETLETYEHALCRSARRDPGLLATLRSNPLASKQASEQPVHWAKSLGAWIGSYADSEVAAELEAVVRSLAAGLMVEDSLLVGAYGKGLATARNESALAFDPFLPAAGTHLADGFIVKEEPLSLDFLNHDDAMPPLDVTRTATWLFCDIWNSQLAESGIGAQITLKNARHQFDEFSPPHRYVSLEVPGACEIHLGLEMTKSRVGKKVEVLIQFQKASRERLMLRGEADLIVKWNGVEVSRARITDVSSDQVLLPRLDAAADRHELVISLGPQSNTPIWVHSISIRNVYSGQY